LTIIPLRGTLKKEDKAMKALSKTWERLFTAITFAQAGEFETARDIMRESLRYSAPKFLNAKNKGEKRHDIR